MVRRDSFQSISLEFLRHPKVAPSKRYVSHCSLNWAQNMIAYLLMGFLVTPHNPLMNYTFDKGKIKDNSNRIMPFLYLYCYIITLSKYKYNYTISMKFVVLIIIARKELPDVVKRKERGNHNRDV